MKRALFILLLILFPISSASAEGLNAGFVQGIWYGEEPFFADETVRVFAALRNNAEAELTATVRFTDNGGVIGEQRVNALSGRLVETWVDWEPTEGEHELEAILTNIRIHSVGSDADTATVTYAIAKDTILVDRDTDGDDIGDRTDTDDDNDGMGDEDEIEAGTDPLVFDEPEPEEDENEEENESEESTDSSESESASTNSDNNDSSPVGLEQYLQGGVVKNTLARVTTGVNSSKTTLDDYRERRSQVKSAETTATSSNGSDQNENSDGPATITVSKIEEESPGLMTKIVGLISSLIGGAYTLVLFVASLYLGHPAIVQMTLLILILFFLYKVARRLTKRPV